MKVLWLSHFVPYPPTGHGALQRTHSLFKETARRHEVHLLALSQPGTLDTAGLADAGRVLGEMAASVRIFPLPADRRGVHRAGKVVASLVGRRSYWDEWFRVPAMERAVAELARTHAFDVVHLDTLFLEPYLGAVPGVPVVLNHHNLESHLLRRRAAAHASALGRRFFALQAARVDALERSLAPRVAVNLVVSGLDGERLRELAPAAATAIVPNGVDVDYFRPRGDQPVVPGSLVFAGGMDWFPNRAAIQWLAAELWPALAEDNPERTMTVIGRNPPAEATAAAARDPRLRVLGFVDDVRPYVERAAAYLCPIQVGGGTRLKILDALAMARPLVSTTIGVEGLGLTEGVHYLGAETAGEFAAQLTRLEADPALQRALADAGRAYVEARYAWGAIWAAMDAAYHAASGQRAGSAGRPAGEERPTYA